MHAPSCLKEAHSASREDRRDRKKGGLKMRENCGNTHKEAACSGRETVEGEGKINK